MNESKKIVLKISLLYALTTLIFLAIVFYGWYQKEKESLIEERVLQLRESTHNLAMHLYEKLQLNYNGNFFKILEETSKELEIPFSLSTSSGEIIFSTLKEVENTKEFRQILQERGIPISFRKDHRHIDRIVIAGDNVYLVTQRIGGRFWSLVNMELYKQNLLDTLESRNDFFMIIQDNGISKEIYRLWGLIGGSFLLVLFGVSVVAYFLVRLSLKPLEEKIQALNNFIKDSTHEINTPLSIILMSIERIKKEDLKEQDLQKFERIKMAANTLGQIYQDLVFYNFPHLQGNNLEKIAMNDLLKERVSYFEPFYKKKNISIVLKAESSTLMANKSRIIRVVDNLLDNALKYTQSGGEVEVFVGNNFLKIKDNGCGMEKEDLKRIFDRYYRCNKDQGGFGIGLALIKEICNIYKIAIECENQKRERTTFVLHW